jgi:hypothetical protein
LGVDLAVEAYKIWRNPVGPGESPEFKGDFYPPEDQLCFFSRDLRELGFPAGHYTVLVPASVRAIYALPEWQNVQVCE